MEDRDDAPSWRRVAAQLRRPESRALLDAWLAARDGARLPRRADLTAPTFAALRDRLVLLRVAPRPEAFHYEHFGAAFQRQHGFDMTGRTIADWPPSIQPGAVAAYAAAMAAGGFWYRYSPTALDGRPHATEKIYLPFGADGETVDHVLVGTFDVTAIADRRDAR